MNLSPKQFAVACLLALLLTGCRQTGPDWATLPPRPAPLPPMARFTEFAPLPPPTERTVTLLWLNNNTGNPAVQTGIVSAPDLKMPMELWMVRFQTNCDAVTNTCTLPEPSGPEFYRAFTE